MNTKASFPPGAKRKATSEARQLGAMILIGSRGPRPGCLTCFSISALAFFLREMPTHLLRCSWAVSLDGTYYLLERILDPLLPPRNLLLG